MAETRVPNRSFNAGGKPKQISRTFHGLHRDSDRILNAWRRGEVDKYEALMFQLAIDHRLRFLERQELRSFVASAGHSYASQGEAEDTEEHHVDPLEWEPEGADGGEMFND